MNPSATPAALAEYLLRLDRSLWGIGAARRREILRSVGEFMEEDLFHCGQEGLAGLQWLLREHGTPEAMGNRFRVAEWRDRILVLAEVLVPGLAALAWMLVMGALLGVGHRTPGYFTFLADFPALLLVIASVRRSWRGAPVPRRYLLCALTGLATGLIQCHEVCGGRGVEMLEHGLYGAFLGLGLERCSARPGLSRRLLDMAGFLLLMQLTYIGRVGHLEPMPPDCLVFHLLNGLGVQLAMWAAGSVFRAIRQSEALLAPEL